MEKREEYIKLINDFILNVLKSNEKDLKDILPDCIIDKNAYDEYVQKHTMYSLQNIKEGNNVKPEPTKLLTYSNDSSSGPITGPSTGPSTEPITEPITKPITEPITEPSGLSTSRPRFEPTAQEILANTPVNYYYDELNANTKGLPMPGGAIDILDLRTIIDFKKLGKQLIKKVFYQYSSSDVSSIVKNGINDTTKYKLFLGGAKVEEVKPTNIYECWEDNDMIVLLFKYAIVHYQCLKFALLKMAPEYRNKKRMEDDVKNNKDAMARYIKWIYDKYSFPQMKKFIGSTASLFNYSTATPEEPTDSKIKILLSFYLLKDFFKRNNNEYLKKDLYKDVEYKPLTNKKQIPLRLLQASAKPDIHFDKMIADRYTNSSKSFTPNDLTNLLGMMNFQSKLKNQVGGSQYGGSHLYEHIFKNLQDKLAGYKIKINHNDEVEISKYINDLADNEKKIVDSLDTIKKFTYSKNIGDYKGYEVSVDDMYNEIIKTRKDSADKEDKLMGFITKLNRWIKEHFNE